MRKLLAVAFICLIITAIAGSFAYQALLSPTAPTTAFTYQLKSGISLNQVAHDLHAAGVLRSPFSLRLLASLNNQSGKIQSGTYLFTAMATPEEILGRLVRGDVIKASLTIPEGFTLKQIIQRIAELGYGRLARLQELAASPDFIHSLGVKSNSLEGYLYPETYLFTPGIDESQLLKMMVGQFHQHLTPKLLAHAESRNLNLHQLVTLASIIEKETGRIDEMPLISSVFHNRLTRNIPLQTDPTVIYGIDDFDGNLTRKHLQTRTPYNTYVIRGLPPGPIASPGQNALQAAAEPAETNFLYFVARGDGSHQFSSTLKEHNIAVRKYQLKRRR